MTVYNNFIVNCNENVKVRLTQIGLGELEREHNELLKTYPSLGAFTPPSTDADGWSTFQLHDLMNKFGHLMRLGSNPPFEMGIWIPATKKTVCINSQTIPILNPTSSCK